MKLRSVLSLSFTVEQVKKLYQIDAHPFLAKYGLAELQPGSVISQAQELAVLAEIAPRLAHDPLAPIKVSSSFGLSAYGALAMMLMNCPTLYDMLQVGLRYQELTFLFSELSFSLENNEAALILTPCPLPDNLKRFIIDRDLAGTFQFLNLMQSILGQNSQPLRVDIPYPEPAEAEFYQQQFNCPVRFNSDVVRFVVSPTLLRTAIPNASSAAFNLYQQQCDEILAQRQHLISGSLAKQVSHFLALFHGNFPSISECAAAFGYSERQFRRLLKDEDKLYQELLDGVKNTKACMLLQGKQSVEQISLTLGYTEAAAFIRAFRKWQGITPAQYRKSIVPTKDIS